MVAFNHPKLLVFIIVLNAVIFSMFSILPSGIVSSFSNVKTPVSDDYDGFIDNETSNDNWNATIGELETSTLGGWNATKAYLSFMFGGIITVSGLPTYISLPILIFLWALNLILIIDLIAFIREMVGFT